MLGVSTRGVERAVRRGHLAVQYRDSKHGKKAWFRPADLERYQRRQETRVPMGFSAVVAPQLSTPIPGPGPGPTIGAVVPVVDMDDWPRKDKGKRKQADNPVPIAERLTLRLHEAVQLSGLPHTFLIENIHQGKLKAITIGRRHYVKRADLNEFVQAL